MKLQQLAIETQPTSSVLDLLDKNVIGTPGESLVYQQLDTRSKIVQIDKPHFLNLNRKAKTIATCCFCERETSIDTVPVVAFYIRYFTFLEVFRPKTKNKSTSPKKKKNQIREEVEHILAGNHLVSKHEATYFYAYVDPNNVRSAILCEELGFQTLGSFKSYMFGRLFPKKRIHFSQITSSEKDHVTTLLLEQYKNYNAYTKEGLFDNDNYYYIKDNHGDIVVGLQVYITNWNVMELGGRFGKTLLNILNGTPILRRLIRKKYSFLAIDHVYAKPGYTKQLEALIESLLNRFNLFSALILVDTNSNLYTEIEQMNKGLMGKIKSPNTIHSIFKPLNMTDSELKTLKNNPTFISSFDTT